MKSLWIRILIGDCQMYIFDQLKISTRMSLPIVHSIQYIVLKHFLADILLTLVKEDKGYILSWQWLLTFHLYLSGLWSIHSRREQSISGFYYIIILYDAMFDFAADVTDSEILCWNF